MPPAVRIDLDLRCCGSDRAAPAGQLLYIVVDSLDQLTGWFGSLGVEDGGRRPPSIVNSFLFGSSPTPSGHKDVNRREYHDNDYDRQGDCLFHDASAPPGSLTFSSLHHAKSLLSNNADFRRRTVCQLEREQVAIIGI
jgi:hypothetical protein